MPIDWAPFVEFVRQPRRLLLTTHVRPDGDGLGSMLALADALQTLGKDFSDPPRNWLIHQKWNVDGICPRHRTPLRHGTIGGRTTAWCPRCQR